MKPGLLVAIAAFIVIMLGGCDDGGGSINEKRAEAVESFMERHEAYQAEYPVAAGSKAQRVELICPDGTRVMFTVTGQMHAMYTAKEDHGED